MGRISKWRFSISTLYLHVQFSLNKLEKIGRGFQPCTSHDTKQLNNIAEYDLWDMTDNTFSRSTIDHSTVARKQFLTEVAGSSFL